MNPEVQPEPQYAVQPRRGVNMAAILLAIMTIAVLILGTLTTLEFSVATKAKADLKTAVSQAARQAKSDQKAADKTSQEKLSESPFRTYKAPVLLGGFEIKFPKNWSAYLIEDDNGSPQIDLALQPDFVAKSINGKQALYAAHIKFVRQATAELNTQYQAKVAAKQATASDVTVSQIKATQYRGKLDGQNESILVLVPVRDKTILIACEDLHYEPEFREILAQASIIP